jgi:hypothetical protein
MRRRGATLGAAAGQTGQYSPGIVQRFGNRLGVESEIEINGKAFAFGVSESDVEVPAYGTALLPLRVYSSVFDIIKSAVGLRNQEQLRYHIKGKLRLGSGAFPSVLPFESEGNISLPDIPELRERRPLSD